MGVEKALVTGGLGFIGSRVVDELGGRGYSVRVLDNVESGPGRSSAVEDESLDLLEGDIRDREDVRDAMEGVDVAVHLAAYTSVPGSLEEPAFTSDVNCTGTSVVLEEARREEVKKVALASSAAVYGGQEPPLSEDDSLSPESPYALSKQWTEELASQFESFHGLETVSLRYFNVYGPGQSTDSDYAAVVPAFVSAVQEGSRPVVYGDGEQTRDFVHVEDVARATVDALEADAGGVFNVASGSETSINELLALVLDAAGSDLEPRYESERKGDVQRSYADVSKIEQEIGFSSSIPLKSGVEDVVESYEGP